MVHRQQIVLAVAGIQAHGVLLPFLPILPFGTPATLASHEVSLPEVKGHVGDVALQGLIREFIWMVKFRV